MLPDMHSGSRVVSSRTRTHLCSDPLSPVVHLAMHLARARLHRACASESSTGGKHRESRQHNQPTLEYSRHCTLGGLVVRGEWGRRCTGRRALRRFCELPQSWPATARFAAANSLNTPRVNSHSAIYAKNTPARASFSPCSCHLSLLATPGARGG